MRNSKRFKSNYQNYSSRNSIRGENGFSGKGKETVGAARDNKIGIILEEFLAN